MKPRILFLLTQDLDSPSGGGRYEPMAYQLCQLGWDVRVAALHPDYTHLLEKHQEHHGFMVDYVASMHVRKQGSQKTYYSPLTLLWVTAWATLRLTTYALAHPADVILVGKPHPMNGIAGMAARLFHGSYLVIDYDDDEAESNRFSGKWQYKVVAYFERHLPKSANRLVTNTQVTWKKLVSYGVKPGQMTYIPNGIILSPEGQRLLAEQNKLRQELGLGDASVVLYAGSLSLKTHPIDLLLEAFCSIHAVKPDTRLLVVGGGEDFLTLQEAVKRLGIQDWVIFTGRVAKDQVQKYYQVADVSVDPVYDDATARARSPLKLFESWAAGVPFVSAKVGDRPILAGDPPAALLVEPGSPEALAQAILQILTDPVFARQLRERGLERVRAYTWDRLAAQLNAILRQDLTH